MLIQRRNPKLINSFNKEKKNISLCNTVQEKRKIGKIHFLFQERSPSASSTSRHDRFNELVERQKKRHRTTDPLTYLNPLSLRSFSALFQLCRALCVLSTSSFTSPLVQLKESVEDNCTFQKKENNAVGHFYVR